MELDDRKWTILKAIIKTYLETGEPVGSRTISKDPDLNLSSATIRNEMSDLEDMGLIIQPHTSSGRIPSDAGYRLYVDRLMEEKEAEVSQMKQLMITRQDKMELLLKQIVRFLAVNTNYATMITSPQYHRIRLKFIQLSIVDEEQILATVVAEGNVVKNRIIRILHGLGREQVLQLNILLNSRLNGLTIEEINLATIQKLKEEAGISSDLISQVLDAVADAISQEEDIEVYTSGATNIFKYPELSADTEKASGLIEAFEEKHPLLSLMNGGKDEEHSIQVSIGTELQNENMKDCSVVTASYDLGGGMYGRIGIVGPRRMDYDKVVGILKDLTSQLDRIYTADLINYNKALLQRNDLLKFPKEGKEFSGLLDVWDEQLVRYGKAVMTARKTFIEELDAIASGIHRDLTGGRETLSLAYAPSVSPENMEEKLFLGRDIDIRLGSTQTGPHRDDMECLVNGIDVRKFGSQGQQRTAALSLKLAEIELVRQKINDTPVLLLDDVLSELDSDRQERLLGSLAGVQTFLSCTGLDDFIGRAVDVRRKYRVEENKVEEITNE